MTYVAIHIALILASLAGVKSPAQAQAVKSSITQVYIVPYTHIDVGYTDPVPVVLENHHRYLDSVLVYIDRTRNQPEGSRFKWAIEIPWILETYLATRSPEVIDRLMAHVRAGDIEIGALHFGLQADLASSEELVRALAYAHRLRETYEIPIRTAVLNDTPGFTWSLAQLLPKSGVPFLSLAMNSALSDFYSTTDLPNLFYWQAQSGDRTLVWRSIHDQWAYLEGVVWGAYGGYDNFESRLTQLLNGHAASGYPHDAILVNAATGDNGAPNLSIVENVRRWNEAHPDVEVIISTFSEFFDHASRYDEADIPTFSGDAPNWWSWSFAVSATGGFLQSRAVQKRLPAAETFAAVADALVPGYVYPADELRKAYVNSLLYSDHNMGGLSPAADAEFWPRKMAWVEAASETADGVLDGALGAISGMIASGQDATLVVFNSSPWPRTDVISFQPDSPVDIVDARTGVPAVQQPLSDGGVAFLADDVPAVGYTTYRLTPGGASDTPGTGGSDMENAYYRVSVDPATGSVARLVDKIAGRELTKPGGRFSQYLYNSSAAPSGMTVVRSDSGAVLQRLVLRGQAAGSNWYETEVALPAGVRRIDFNHRYDKRPPTSFEGVDFRFDFGLDSPELRYDIPFGHARLFEDELGGFRSRHYAAQSWFGISSGDGAGVVLATSGPSIHSHGGDRFDGNLRILTSFNTSGTEYRAGVGELSARFSLTSAEGPTDATRFAERHGRPLEIWSLPPGQAGALPASFSFLSIDSSLTLTTLKRSDRGEGFIARLFNPGPEAVIAGTASDLEIRSITEMTPVEERLEGQSPVLQPFEIKTLLLDVASPTGIREMAPTPEGVVLGQNYPNPFSAETRFRYYLETPAAARLVVHDLLGREVAVVDERQRRAGWHEIDFTGGGLSNGIYFYTLTTSAGTRATRKLVLMR